MDAEQSLKHGAVDDRGGEPGQRIERVRHLAEPFGRARHIRRLPRYVPTVTERGEIRGSFGGSGFRSI